MEHQMLGLVLSTLSILPCAAKGVGESVAADGSPNITQFRAYVLSLRSFEMRLRTETGKTVAQLAGEILREIDGRGTGLGQWECRTAAYYRARMVMLSGDHAAARRSLIALAEYAAVSPLCLAGLMELDVLSGTSGVTRKCYDLLAALLPASTWGNLGNLRGTPTFMDVEGRPVVPSVTREGLERIADLYCGMGFYPAAADSYREAIYGGYGLPSIPYFQPRQETWVSWATGGLWIRAAAADWRSAKVASAFECLAKAIVFGADEQKAAALRELASFEAEKREGTAPGPPKGRADPEVLKQIAKLYASMNLHPRAIDVLKKHTAALGEEGRLLQEELAQAWAKLATQFSMCRTGPCFLFGQELGPKENWARISIPPPLSEEALKEVVRVLQASKGGGKE